MIISRDDLSIESATSAAPSVQFDTTSPALLLVSGGTTCAPKLILRTRKDYVYNFTASAEPVMTSTRCHCD